jgi:CBS domain-containing protein
MQVAEIMSSKLETISPNHTLTQAAQKMRDDNIGSLPVVESERLIGIVTDRDIVVRCVADGADTRAVTVRQAMSADAAHCLADQSVEEASKVMAAAKVRRLPVIDRDRRLVGIVSLGDLSRSESTHKAGETLRDISEPTDRPNAI